MLLVAPLLYAVEIAVWQGDLELAQLSMAALGGLLLAPHLFQSKLLSGLDDKSAGSGTLAWRAEMIVRWRRFGRRWFAPLRRTMCVLTASWTVWVFAGLPGPSVLGLFGSDLGFKLFLLHSSAVVLGLPLAALTLLIERRWSRIESTGLFAADLMTAAEIGDWLMKRGSLLLGSPLLFVPVVLEILERS